MRKINEIILHCSATPKNMDIGVKEIREWHKQRGWKDIGYHIVIRRNGVVEDGRKLAEIGAHCYGKNRNSIGICLVGEGKTHESFTEKQYESLENIIYHLSKLFTSITKISQHSDYDNNKPFCAGLNEGQMFFFNEMIK